MTSFKGIFPALVTPFKKDGSINIDSLKKLVRMNLEKEVDGFYIGGSTGEAFLLSMEERKQLIDIVVDEVKGKCTLIAHIGCVATDHAVELAKHAENAGVDAISSVPPFYYKFSFDEIKSYYFDIVEKVNLPMIVYNFPALSGVVLTTENICEFAKDTRFIGIKHTSMDLFQLERIKKENPSFLVFNGHDEVFLGGLAMGADGAIGSTFNFMSEKFIKIKKLFDAGKLNEAYQIQTEANGIINVLLKTGVIPGTKYILGRMGIDCGDCRRPFRQLSNNDKIMLDACSRALHKS
jgi:N-acetylneuraminate lyase